jgi:hypothetical protein
MIISNDPRVDEALRLADDGNFSQLQEVLRAAQDKPRNSSMDLVNDLGLEQLDLGFFDMGGSAKPSPPASHRSSSPPPSETSASGGAQFQFDDDMWDILDTAAGNDGMMSTSVGGNDSHMAMSWDRGNDRGMGSGSGLSGMGSFGGGVVGRQRLPSQSGSFSTFFGMTPPMDSTLEMYGNSPNSALAMSMDKSTTDALTGGRGPGAFSKISNGSVSINLQSGLSKMMSKAPAGGIAANGIGESLDGGAAGLSAPMAIPKRAETPIQLGPDGKPIKKMVGEYSPESRRARIARYDDYQQQHDDDDDDDVWEVCCVLLLLEIGSDLSLSTLSSPLSSSPSTFSSSPHFFPFPFSPPKN